MYRGFMTLTLGCMLAAFLPSSQALCQTPDSSTQPDNTKVNKRDRQPDQPTADQQKENATDRELAKNVRRAIVKDKSLSSYAHNVKVIAQNGTVTLKGPVHSEEESKAVEAKAAEVAGAGNVKNELSVKGDTSGHSARKD